MITVTQEGTNIYIEVDDGEILNSFESTEPGYGEGQWIALAIETGDTDITKVTYNGEYLTGKDVADAQSMGLPAGSFVLWVKAEELPKIFTLGGEGKEDKTFTVELLA